MKTIKTTENIKVIAIDEPGDGGVPHEYMISRAKGRQDIPAGEYGFVRFQKGSIKQTGVNGCQIEDLLAICIHQIDGLRDWDELYSMDLEIISDNLKWAIDVLEKRTKDRQKRGVEEINKESHEEDKIDGYDILWKPIGNP